MSWKHLSDTTPIATFRTYRCYLCDLEISKGVQHVHRSGTNNGELFVMRMHMQCEKLTKNWKLEDWEEPIDYIEFRKLLNKGI